MAKKKAQPAAPKELTEQEKLELELEEAGRSADGDWGGPPPGKPKNLGPTVKRLLGLLAPFKWLLATVFAVGSIGVVLLVLAPKVLGEATNVVVEGFIQGQMPEGATQDQIVEGLRQQGEDDFANMIAAMQNFNAGAGIDFERLAGILAIVLGLYVAASLFNWLQGFVINRVVQQTVRGLREDVENKVHSLPLGYYDSMNRGELLSR
ncbi:MAG: ABC transporter transmembrane domain-containing protein, partial [Agrococcus casei]|uniref:ABC transporter transmembrane domain-containing protein n=1 Tax=Agrococcus casei TaxID=343512 RepID=UPI003F9760B2